MKSLKEKTADAVLELHASIMDVRDYTEFPSILESILKKIFHLDWLAMFSFGEGPNAYNIVTNPWLPFDWNEKYIELYDYDKVRKDTLALDVGGTYIYDRASGQDNEKLQYVFETVKKYTDTSHFLTLHTAKTDTFDSAIGIYRTDNDHQFTQDEKQALDYLSPLLVSISHMMNVYREFDFQRVAINKLRKSGTGLSLLLDERLVPVDIPQKTERFINKHFPCSTQNCLPDSINHWIKTTIAPKGKLVPNTGPWVFKQRLPTMELYCKAYVVVTEFRQLALLIQLIPHNEPIDFSVLTSSGLTRREIEALSYLPLGYSNTQIAMAMNIEVVTVKKHLKNTAQKLGAHGRTELLYQAIKTKNLLESL